jgi:aquaporin Z
MQSAVEAARTPLWVRHWPEYAMEAALLGTFMLSACLFATLLFYPGWPVARLIPDPFHRRMLMGVAMGSTAVALNYSPWGKQSGAHYNPAVTLTFARLGKIAPFDAVAYVGAQFVGAVLGVLLAGLIVRGMLADSSVHYAVTRPGSSGVMVAFIAEAVISCILMTVVLTVSNRANLARFTGLCAGILVAAFITFEAPLSGMSMNPARTVGSGFWAHDWTALWIYFIAPPLGMLLAAESYVRRQGRAGVFCAKLHHQNEKRCIFCEYQGRGKEQRERGREGVSGERGRRAEEAERAAEAEDIPLRCSSG